MNITCPECGFSRSVPDDKIPVASNKATCPKCRARFTFRPPAVRRQPETDRRRRSPGPDAGIAGRLRERPGDGQDFRGDPRAARRSREDVEFYTETRPVEPHADDAKPLTQDFPEPDGATLAQDSRGMATPEVESFAESSAETFAETFIGQPQDAQNPQSLTGRGPFAGRRPVSPTDADELWGGPPERPAAPPVSPVRRQLAARASQQETADDAPAASQNGFTQPAAQPATASPSPESAAPAHAQAGDATEAKTQSAWGMLKSWGQTARSASARQDPATDSAPSSAPNLDDAYDEDYEPLDSSLNAGLDEDIGDAGFHEESRDRRPAPWEDERLDVFSALVRTARSALLAPGSFFGGMRLGGGFPKPLLYVLVVSELAAVADFVLEVAGVSTWAIMRGAAGSRLSSLWLLLLYPACMCLGVAAMSVYRRFFLSFTGAFSELGNMSLGVSPLEAVFRTLAYASSAALIWVVPLIGPPLAIFWFALISLIGLKSALKASYPQVALACLIPDLVLGLAGAYLALSFGLAP